MEAAIYDSIGAIDSDRNRCWSRIGGNNPGLQTERRRGMLACHFTAISNMLRLGFRSDCYVLVRFRLVDVVFDIVQGYVQS